MPDAYEYDVFISFASGDEDLVRPIWQDLSSSGLLVFWSDAVLKDRLGESWFNVIQQALPRSRHFLLVWTPRAASSVWVEREYVAFLQDRQSSTTRRFVPYLTANGDISSLPLFLRQFEACRAADPDVTTRMTHIFGGVDIAALKQQIAELAKENARLAGKIRELTLSHSAPPKGVQPQPKADSSEPSAPRDQDAETIQTKDSAGRLAFLGTVTLLDGTDLPDCVIWNFHPAYGGGGFNEESVGVSTSIDAAVDNNTNRTRRLLFRKIARITVLPLSDADAERTNTLDSYTRQALLKCDIEFHNGSSMRGVFLMPHQFRYCTDIEHGDIRQDTIRSVTFTGRAAQPKTVA